MKYAINYAYPSSTQAKKLGYVKEGVAYLQQIKEGDEDNIFYTTEDDVVKKATTVKELVDYCENTSKELGKYSLR